MRVSDKSNLRRLVRAVSVSTVLGGVLLPQSGGLWADTLLFPVIASNTPNVITLISVSNRPDGTSSYLR